MRQSTILCKTGVYHYSNEAFAHGTISPRMIAEYNATTDLRCATLPQQLSSQVLSHALPIRYIDKTKIKETFGIRIPYWTESLKQCITNLEKTTIMEKVRDLTLDIVKAICIMLMVVGHSGCPTYLHDFLYLFHMPCFFFISGWLLSDKYIDDLKTGLLKKVKGSYVPFVKWTLIFLLFHNVFASVHIYADSYSWQTFIERVVRTFTMTGGESLSWWIFGS